MITDCLIDLEIDLPDTSDYLHAVNIWNMFEIKTMGSYRDLYLKIDVLLLTDVDVFEKFIGVCLEYYGLNPFH